MDAVPRSPEACRTRECVLGRAVFLGETNTTSQIRWRIRTLFEAKRHTIQAHVAKVQLERAYKVRAAATYVHWNLTSYCTLTQWLDVFVRAKQGDTYFRAVLDRYDRMIASKRERREFSRLVREALVCSTYSRPFVITPTNQRYATNRKNKPACALAPSSKGPSSARRCSTGSSRDWSLNPSASRA